MSDKTTMSEALKSAKKVDEKKKQPAADGKTEGKKKNLSGEGKGKGGARVKLVDAKAAILTIIRKKRADGQFVVHAVHLPKVGGEAKTGMVHTLPNELAATKRFDELVDLAKKAGWQLVAGKAKEVKNEFDAFPAAAK